MTRSLLRRSVPWFGLGLLLAIAVAMTVYARLGDSYVVTAVTTAPPSEAKSYDLASLSGLAALGGGGQRTTFEEFGFLIGSEANVRAVLATRRHARSLAEFAQPGGIEQVQLDIEQWARALFGKEAKIVDPKDRMVGIAQKLLEVKKTPEGYYAIALRGAQPEGKVALLQALIGQADETVRQRAIADYKGRIATYQHLVDIEQRTAERVILISLIAREYTTYASAQSGQVFAFDYVEAPVRATKNYAPSFLLVLIGMTALWAAACIAYVIVRSSQLRP